MFSVIPLLITYYDVLLLPFPHLSVVVLMQMTLQSDVVNIYALLKCVRTTCNYKVVYTYIKSHGMVACTVKIYCNRREINKAYCT